MLRVDTNDRVALEQVLVEHSLDDVSSIVERGAFLCLTLPCFSDEQIVMADLDFSGVGFSFSHE